MIDKGLVTVFFGAGVTLTSVLFYALVKFSGIEAPDLHLYVTPAGVLIQVVGLLIQRSEIRRKS